MTRLGHVWRALAFWIGKAWRAIDLDAHDACTVGGFGSLVYGVSLWSEPAAWMTAGVILLSISVWPPLRRLRKG